VLAESIRITLGFKKVSYNLSQTTTLTLSCNPAKSDSKMAPVYFCTSISISLATLRISSLERPRTGKIKSIIASLFNAGGSSSSWHYPCTVNELTNLKSKASCAISPLLLLDPRIYSYTSFTTKSSPIDGKYDKSSNASWILLATLVLLDSEWTSNFWTIYSLRRRATSWIASISGLWDNTLKRLSDSKKTLITLSWDVDATAAIAALSYWGKEPS
jgi:hypothetical protein